MLVQAWDFAPGSNWVFSIAQGVQGAARTVAVLSRAYATSVYGTAEWQAAWASDPLGRQRKLLVARVEGCPRPGMLAQVISIDLFPRTARWTEDRARSMLLDAARRAITGARAKLPPLPAFPPGTA